MPEFNEKAKINAEELSTTYKGIIKGIRTEIELMNNFIGQNIYKAANESPDGLDKFISEDPNAEEPNSKKTILGLNNSKDGYNVAGVEENAQKSIIKLKTLINDFVGQNLYEIVGSNPSKLDKSILENPHVQNKINELKTLSVDIEAIGSIENEIKKFGKKAREDLNSKAEVTTRLNQYIKVKGVIENIGIVDENGKGIADKREIIQQIGEEIKLSEPLYKTGLKNIEFLKPLQDIANIRAAEIFAVDEKKDFTGWCYIDRAKLTPENIDKFTKLVNHDIQAFSVIQENLSPKMSIEENQKTASALIPTISKLSPEELQEKGSKIVKDFAPLFESKNKIINEKAETALNNLDPAYLEENSTKIVSELKEINDKGISLWEKFKSIFRGKNYLNERLEKSVNKYIELSDEYVEKEISNKIFSNALTNEQIAVGLTKFMNKNIDPKEVNNPDLNLVEIRKANPAIFDKLLFEKQAQTPLENKSSKFVNHINKEKAGRGL